MARNEIGKIREISWLIREVFLEMMNFDLRFANRGYARPMLEYGAGSCRSTKAHS